jgi:hypothetical protein
MKKIIVFSMLLVLLVCQRALSQDNFRFTIKTNPFAALGGPLYVAFVPITGEYKVLFESRTAHRQSIQFGAGYLGPSILLNLDELSKNDSVNGVKTSGFRAQLLYKFFLTKDQAPEGFYVGPHISYATAKIVNKDISSDYFKASKLTFSVVLGYQLITSGGFALDIFTGLGFKRRAYDFSNEEISDFEFDSDNANVPNVVFGFSFGYAF